ncbi:MAG TPA: carbohydrate-binding family 9-like protein [Candidatus Krumholzibacterium sp.]|nr:carbohydrate-binding family 9-like protein [Candidatus Krumholzibacterium sp.]
MKNDLRTMTIVIAAALAFGSCSSPGEKQACEKISDETFPVPAIEYDPQRYICRKTETPVYIDGRLDEDQWTDRSVSWSAYFTDINGPGGPEPKFRTRIKMLWDEDYLYIGAEMQEPHVWASVTGRDEPVFQDCDFEVFIDPDGDTQEYYEIEINAFGTIRDLLLVRPYRDGGPAVDSWDVQGIMKGVHVDGTINDPGDEDRGWNVELAIPWKVLSECAHRKVPPDEGDIWTMNLSRVRWDAVIEGERYVKKTDPETGRPAPAHDWVWSPQGLENMHYPEMWGLVMFTNPISAGGNSFNPAPVESAMWALRELYYAEKTHFLQYGCYTADIARLGLRHEEVYGHIWPPRLEATSGTFEAALASSDGRTEVRIDNYGRVVSRDLE